MSKADPHDHLKQKKLQKLPHHVKGAVITVSDRCISGEREDKSGPLLKELLADYQVDVGEVDLVPDGVEPVRDALMRAISEGARVIFTTGGTGITERDLTPEGTASVVKVRLDNIAAQIAQYGLKNTPLASLSRGIVGITERGRRGVLIVNAPGSKGGVKDAVAVVGPLIPHLLEQLDPEEFALVKD